MLRIFDQFLRWQRRRTHLRVIANRVKAYPVGAVVAQLVTFDVRREVQVVDNSRIADGFITARVRTFNVLYTSHGLAEPSFSDAQEFAIDDLWTWTGESYGGPVPMDDIGNR